MGRATTDGHDGLSFAETALRLGGKGEDEVRRLGAVDRADEQVETLYAERRRTEGSPVHRAVWDAGSRWTYSSRRHWPSSAPCDAAMQKSLEVVKQRRESAHTIWLGRQTLRRIRSPNWPRPGFWGMLIAPEFGGQGAPFARFAQFHTRMSVEDATVAGMGSVHGCIGAVDPLNTFGTPEQKRRFLPKLADGSALSAFALTEPCAGSDLTALRTTAVEAGDAFEITRRKAVHHQRRSWPDDRPGGDAQRPAGGNDRRTAADRKTSSSRS